jgi:hypothetical protein
MLFWTSDALPFFLCSFNSLLILEQIALRRTHILKFVLVEWDQAVLLTIWSVWALCTACYLEVNTVSDQAFLDALVDVYPGFILCLKHGR